MDTDDPEYHCAGESQELRAHSRGAQDLAGLVGHSYSSTGFLSNHHVVRSACCATYGVGVAPSQVASVDAVDPGHVHRRNRGQNVAPAVTPGLMDNREGGDIRVFDVTRGSRPP